MTNLDTGRCDILPYERGGTAQPYIYVSQITQLIITRRIIPIYYVITTTSISETFSIGHPDHNNPRKSLFGRTVRHELGHALGLFHEHQRPDSSDYVWKNWCAINQAHADELILNIFGVSISWNYVNIPGIVGVTYVTSYDLGSIYALRN